MFATPIERQLAMDHTPATCGNCSSVQTLTGMHMLLALPGETFDHYDFLAAIKPIWKIQACIAVPFIILALPLDVLIILTIVIFRTMHTNNNVFIFGQALSDLMFTLFIPVFVVAHFNPSWYIRGSEASCFVLIAIYTSLKHSGLWMYVSVALDRFIAVHCPFWYDRNMYVKKSIKIVVVIFVFSATVGGIVIFWNNDGKHCNYYDVLPGAYKIVTFSEFNVIPVVPLVLNILIYRTARMKRKDNIGSSNTRVVSSTRVNGSIRARLHNHKDHFRSMHLSILLSGIFVVCWMPLNIMSAVSNVYKHDKTVSIATSVTFILYSAYPLCNAVAIVFSKHHFRPCFRLLLTTRPWRWRLLRNEFDELRRSLSLVGGAMTVLDSLHSDHSCCSLHDGSSRHGLHGATSGVATENPRRVSLAVTLSRVYQENRCRASTKTASSLSVDPTHPTVRVASPVDGEDLREMLRRVIGGGGGGPKEEEETSENGTTIDEQPALTWTLYSPSSNSRRSLSTSETRDFNTAQDRVSGHVGFDVSTSSRFLDVHEAFSKSSKAANKD